MIEARGLTKRFGQMVAVDGLTFSVRPGEVTGFLGRDGAGKTTTLRMILGLQRPTSETVTVDGRPYADLVAPLRHVGSLPDARAVQPGCTATEHLLALARSNGIDRRRVGEVPEANKNRILELYAIADGTGQPGETEAEPNIQVAGEAGTAASALTRIEALRPNVVVLDVRLPDEDGVSVCREIRSRMPEVACLMLTSFGDDEALFDAIMAGAAGYVLKQIRGTDLVGAVRTVASGQSMLDPRAASQLMARLRDQSARRDPLAGLSAQERKILELIGEGLTNRQIGGRMFLAEKTVKNYVSALFAKLGMERRTQAAAYAARVFGDDHGSGDGSHRGFNGPGDQGPDALARSPRSSTRLRICCTVHGPSGFAVTPMMCT